MKKQIRISITTLIIAALFQPACKKKHDDDDPVPQPITLDCADITVDKVLSDVVPAAGAVDYIVPCEIAIEANVTVAPGVVIQFASNTGFSVNNSGSLSAVGTSTSPIIFKGATSAAGSWKGIAFRSNSVSNILSYVTIDGGGSSSFNGADNVANILVDVISQLRISNCIIKNSGRDGLLENGVSSNEENPLKEFSSNQFINNANYPISILPPLAASLDEATTFSGNGKQKICIRGGEITYDATWRKTQVPYFISGNVSVGTWDEGSLTINPGVTIYFDANSSLSKGQYGNGYLKIVGTSSQHITLSSETAVAGSWKGIGFFIGNVQNQVSYTDISYGGCCPFDGSSTSKGNIVVGSGTTPATLNITNSTINFSASCGIKVKTPYSSCIPGTGVTYSGNLGGNLCN